MMQWSLKAQYLCSWLALASTITAVDPADVYDGGFSSQDAKIELRIATGGAGQSGLVKGTCPSAPVRK